MAESTAKKDALVAIERAVRSRWESEKPFEVDAPLPTTDGTPAPPKYFMNFPYPYMNGRLHLGHAFSLSKTEFASRYMRMKGRRVLWPFGLHVTGTPIAACAQKIMKEMERFGNPPVFPPEFFEEQQQIAQNKKEGEAAGGQHKSKRGKSGPAKPQWLIMQDMGIDPKEIPKFADARHWLKYFPSLALEDLKAFGCHIDYRRSFITTEVNPFYDSFIRWQFRNLRELGYLKFGKRYSIYSPRDGQPCADHDRASGEGVLPMEYTVVKLKVQNVAQQAVLAPFMSVIGSRSVVFPGATLRPETVVGLTNCWVSPNFPYKAYIVQSDASAEEEVFLMTAKAARNLAYQGFYINGTTGKDVEPLFEIDGASLIGLPLTGPLAPYATVYTLPMATITEGKGTGVVMSVPSDSPDDYINFIQLVKKPDYRVKLGLKDEWVMPFAIVPIIECPGELGTMAAEVAIAKFKITGPKDADKLEEAKKLVYQTGFYEGKMMCGPYVGMPVAEAKVKTSAAMKASGDAITYYEAQKLVMSRSGEECVVAHCNQWYIAYGAEEWRSAVQKHMAEQMHMYSPAIRHNFEETLKWLENWPCSRTFGLGTKLPCDESNTMIVDSLSDSTIYMAYYTIAQFVHMTADGHLCLDATEPNRYGLTPAMFTDDTWNFIFRGQGTAESLSAATGIPVETAAAMRREFEYWYPVDLRVSAKDLIQNHLTMFLYNHAAIWPNDQSKWPRSIYCNGHIEVDNQKMSKSLGNFISMNQAIADWGSDASRLACADAGDSLDDANFARATASGFIMKLTAFIDVVKEFAAGGGGATRTGPLNIFDSIFLNSVNASITAVDKYYSDMQFRMALNAGFFEFSADYSGYKLLCDQQGVHADVARRYFETAVLMIAPLAPHIADYLWRDVLKKENSIHKEAFPMTDSAPRYSMIVAKRVIQAVMDEIRAKVAKSKTKPDEFFVYVATDFSDWQKAALATLATVYKDNSNSFPEDTIKVILARKEPWLTKDIMQDALAFIAFVRTNVVKYGTEALSTVPAINDAETLNGVMQSLTNLLQIPKIHVLPKEDESVPAHQTTRSKARPGEPAVTAPPAPKK
jgi:leucyl-tRNA synthetase